MVPPGDVFGVIPVWIVVYAAAVVAFGLHGWLLYRRVFLPISLGRPHIRKGDRAKRMLGAVRIVLGQTKVLQSVSARWGDAAGIGHAAIFYGFLIMVAGYALLIFGDSVWGPFSEKLLSDAGLKVFTWFLNITASAILASVLWAIARRAVFTPHRLSFDLTRHLEAYLIVGLIGMLMVSSWLAEAFYVASGGGGPHAAAPIGGSIGRAFRDAGVDGGAAVMLHGLFWWTHYLIILSFAIYIPLSKHIHMVASPLNAYLRRLQPSGTLDPIPDIETAEHFGAGRVQDLTRKELLDGFACAVCGRCTDVCPAHISGKALSPMHVVENVKAYLVKNAADIRAGKQPSEPLIGGAVPEQMLWDCVTCGACVRECPVTVEHIDSIVDMRRYLVMEQSKMPETAKNALVSMEQRGHPWRGTTFTRTDWVKGLDVKTIAEEPAPEVLFWVGCTGALEQRSQAIPRAMAAVLKAAGVRFAILGNEETCTGDPARRMGNEYLFQTMAKQAIETLVRYKVKRIVTICPHCFNTMRNEYPQFGGEFEVLHYTQYVDELIKAGRLKPLRTVEATVAYHDSCYLGRHNGIYDEPRAVARAIPGLKLVEMSPRNRERGFCCGAGGGHMWIEEEGGKRINHVRTEHFLETGAQTVGVSCPFCLQMMVEGISAKGMEGQRQAKDLLELLAESVEPDGTQG
ncbi:MAG: (Fe-S)-binding protein [Dehalococcoidia bacterium]|nr:(Fe-S)-binding protein [Dehalococcoidia bacterium]